MAKMTEKQKQIAQEARDDWNWQCKRFMQSRIPFRDKTMKDCLKRHGYYDKED